MNPLEQIVLAFQVLTHSLRQLFRLSLWAPWLVVLALELGVVIGLWWFAHPLFSWLAAPLIQALAGENALRYPTIFRLMPSLYARADLVIGALVGALATGASTALFGAWFAGRPLRVRDGVSRGVSRGVALILANLPLSLLLLGFSYGLDWWLEEREGPALVRRVAPLLTLGMTVMLQAFFLWVNPLLMLGGRGLVTTLASLPRAAAHGMWTAVTLAVAATIPVLPTQMLARASDQIVERGTPEMVGWLIAAQALIGMVMAFVLTGASALAYQSLVGPALDEDA